MKTNTNALARTTSRLATILAVAVAVSGGLLIAAPAHASYGAQYEQSGWNTACTSRFDSNCILKETNYSIQTAAPYQNYGSNSYYGNSYNQGNQYNYQQPVYYNTYPAQYPQFSANTGYNYNYAYTYSYVTPPSTYLYEDANSAYDYNGDYGDNYNNTYNDTNCDYSYDSCGYSY